MYMYYANIHVCLVFCCHGYWGLEKLAGYWMEFISVCGCHGYWREFISVFVCVCVRVSTCGGYFTIIRVVWLLWLLEGYLRW